MRLKCDGTHLVEAIMFCGSTLCHKPHLHLLLDTRLDEVELYQIDRLKPSFEALMEEGSYDSFHVHLLQYLQRC